AASPGATGLPARSPWTVKTSPYLMAVAWSRSVSMACAFGRVVG
ncbi:hypothetical protein LINGRAPRIM_LOCUS3240, partial [Linum grandiflorum]